MSATKREEVSSHLRYIRLELREMHQMLIKEDLMPDINEAKEVHAQLDALLELLLEKIITYSVFLITRISIHLIRVSSNTEQFFLYL